MEFNIILWILIKTYSKNKKIDFKILMKIKVYKKIKPNQNQTKTEICRPPENRVKYVLMRENPKRYTPRTRPKTVAEKLFAPLC
jgi:hypothetical protein